MNLNHGLLLAPCRPKGETQNKSLQKREAKKQFVN